MLLALTGLCWSANSPVATSTGSLATTASHTALSQTIAELIGLDLDTYSLVAFAIDRAVIAQKVNNGANDMKTVGAVEPIKDVSSTDKKPAIDGKINAPTNPSIGQAKIKKTKKQQPETTKQQPLDRNIRSNRTVGLYFLNNSD